jgi:ketosteroid isomerase-like protein
VSIPPANPARLTRLTNLAMLVLLAPLFPAGRAFSFASGNGSSQSRTQKPAKVAVKAAYEAYLRAWKDKDYDALNDMLSDDYQAVNFQGVISTKANEIATAKKDRTYKTLTGDVMSVAVLGESAVVSGLIVASWKDDTGTVKGSTFRFLAMLQNQKGDWKLVATQSTKFNKQTEPMKK